MALDRFTFIREDDEKLRFFVEDGSYAAVFASRRRRNPEFVDSGLTGVLKLPDLDEIRGDQDWALESYLILLTEAVQVDAIFPSS